jgi:hypothetical protein
MTGINISLSLLSNNGNAVLLKRTAEEWRKIK